MVERNLVRRLVFTGIVVGGLALAAIDLAPTQIADMPYIHIRDTISDGRVIETRPQVCLRHPNRPGVDLPNYYACGGNAFEASQRYIPDEISRAITHRTPHPPPGRGSS